MAFKMVEIAANINLRKKYNDNSHMDLTLSKYFELCS